MKLGRTWPLAISLLLTAGGSADACNPYDANCNPPPQDPCSIYTLPSDYQLCKSQLPKCPGLTGPPLNACLQNNMAMQKQKTSTSTSTSTSNGAGTSTSTSAGSSTSTSTVNRALGYSGTMTDNSLYDAVWNKPNQTVDIVRDPKTGSVVTIVDRSVQTITSTTVDPKTGKTSTEISVVGDIITQNDALNAQSTLMIECTTTNLAGRVDAACAADPNNPECTGMAVALGNGTSCVKFGPKDPKTGVAPCLQYGAYGYTSPEWFVFGQQYFNGMTGCFAVGDMGDVTGAKYDDDQMINRATRMAVDPRLNADPSFVALPTGKAQTMLGSVSGASTVTGDAKVINAESGTTQKWQSVAAKVDDGAAYLGLERGDLIKGAASGQTFSSIVGASPFMEKLAADLKQQIETALADPAETVSGAKEKIAQAGGGNGDGSATPGAPGARSPASRGSTITAAPNPSRPGGTSMGMNSGAGGKISAEALADARALFGGAPAGGTAVGATSSKTAASPQNGSAGASPGAKASAVADGGKPTPFLQSSPEFGTLDASLFERVTITYRRHTPHLKALEDSKTARDVRLTEKPDFFKEL